MFPTGTFEEEIDPVFIKKVAPEHWNFSDKIAFENSWTTTILIQKNIVHFNTKFRRVRQKQIVLDWVHEARKKVNR